MLSKWHLILEGKQRLMIMLFLPNLTIFLSHFVPRQLVEYDKKILIHIMGSIVRYGNDSVCHQKYFGQKPRSRFIKLY